MTRAVSCQRWCAFVYPRIGELLLNDGILCKHTQPGCLPPLPPRVVEHGGPWAFGPSSCVCWRSECGTPSLRGPPWRASTHGEGKEAAAARTDEATFGKRCSCQEANPDTPWDTLQHPRLTMGPAPPTRACPCNTGQAVKQRHQG